MSFIGGIELFVWYLVVRRGFQFMVYLVVQSGYLVVQRGFSVIHKGI